MNRTERNEGAAEGGRVTKRRSLSMKTIALAVALVACLSTVLNGTVAYLSDVTGTLHHEFSVGFLKITLNDDQNGFANAAAGSDITRNATVTVTRYSDACWLFVQCTEKNWNSGLSYTMARGWKELGADYPGVYYRKVARSTNNTTIGVLAGNKIKVSNNVTDEEIADIRANTRLEFKAFAIGQDGLSDETTAWNSLGGRAIQDVSPKTSAG